MMFAYEYRSKVVLTDLLGRQFWQLSDYDRDGYAQSIKAFPAHQEEALLRAYQLSASKEKELVVEDAKGLPLDLEVAV